MKNILIVAACAAVAYFATGFILNNVIVPFLVNVAGGTI